MKIEAFGGYWSQMEKREFTLPEDLEEFIKFLEELKPSAKPISSYGEFRKKLLELPVECQWAVLLVLFPEDSIVPFKLPPFLVGSFGADMAILCATDGSKLWQEWSEKLQREALERGMFQDTLDRFARIARLIHETGYSGVGISPPFENLLKQIKSVGESGNNPVLILGPTGTGKELVARSLHEIYKRNGRLDKFISINCAGLDDQLAESALFGHAKGAFTGAGAKKLGYVHEAQGGTLFLDELTEANAQLQARLLRFLNDFSFARVGETESSTADIQIIAATNRNILNAIEEGKLREDLYNRFHHRIETIDFSKPLCLEDWLVIALRYLQDVRKENEPIYRLSRKGVVGLYTAVLGSKMAGASDVVPRNNIRGLQSALDEAILKAESEGTRILDFSHFDTNNRKTFEPPDLFEIEGDTYEVKISRLSGMFDRRSIGEVAIALCLKDKMGFRKIAAGLGVKKAEVRKESKAQGIPMKGSPGRPPKKK